MLICINVSKGLIAGTLLETSRRMYNIILSGTSNREPQGDSRSVIEYKDLGRHTPIIFLLYSWGFLSGVPSEVPSTFQTLLHQGTAGVAV